MVGNPPDPDKRGPKTTILVVPGSILGQWHDELDKHVERKTFGKVMIYKASHETSMENLEDQDVIREWNSIYIPSRARIATLILCSHHLPRSHEVM